MAATAPARLPRGIRNNNPGNIRHGTDWMGDEPDGVAPADAEFERFDAPVLGLRALMRILLTYRRRHGLATVAQIIGRWAPPAENDTEAYIRMVAFKLGVPPDARIDPTTPDMLAGLARAIARHENGPAPQGWPLDWYDADVYAEAARLALGHDV